MRSILLLLLFLFCVAGASIGTAFVLKGAAAAESPGFHPTPAIRDAAPRIIRRIETLRANAAGEPDSVWAQQQTETICFLRTINSRQ